MTKSGFFLVLLSSATLFACQPTTQEFPEDINEELAYLTLADTATGTCSMIEWDTENYNEAWTRIFTSASKNNIAKERILDHFQNTGNMDQSSKTEIAILNDYLEKAGLGDRNFDDAEFTQKFCAQAVKEDQQNTKIGQLIVVNG